MREMSVEKRNQALDTLTGKVSDIKEKVQVINNELQDGIEMKKFPKDQLGEAKKALKRGTAIVKALDKASA